MSDSCNSDDERYANDTFEQESDTDIPEMGEIESEISEASDDGDDDALPSVKLATGSIKRTMNFNNTKSAPNNTDAIPFDSSSDEEDDVVVGQTLAEINTPSMHFADDQTISRNNHEFMNANEQSESSVGEEDSDEEREFQRIKDMEERYMLQNSAKTPKSTNRAVNIVQTNHTEDLVSNKTNEQETDIEAMTKTASVESPEECDKPVDINRSPVYASVIPTIDPIPELIEKVMEQFTPQPRVPPQIQTNFMEIVQNSLTSLIAGRGESTSESSTVNHQFEPNNMLSPENITSALIEAFSSSNTKLYKQNGLINSKEQEDSENATGMSSEEHECKITTSRNNFIRKDTYVDEINDAKEIGNAEEEVEVERTSPPLLPEDDDDYEDESYSGTQFEYEISSKPPSCFNSDDYVFHANFIRPSPTTDKLRPRPQPRKSMSFSNERMREIERHNQILLRKILTQKPTYVARSSPPKPQYFRPNCQSGNNGRLTTSALNRKKQQRQIDLDNQVLKRKIEAIALRRRPHITS